MGLNPKIDLIESKQRKKSVPQLKSGDIVKVHQKIIEGEKERIQIFEGVVIAVKHSLSMDGTFTVRRIASGVGVERNFPLHSPKIVKIERIKTNSVRQAKIYYIRELTGRKSRLKSKRTEKEIWEEVADKEANKNIEIIDETPDETLVEEKEVDDTIDVAENEVKDEVVEEEIVAEKSDDKTAK